MGGVIGGSGKSAPQVVETVTPTIVDNSAKTRDEESKRRKRYGAATQFLAGTGNTNNANTSKTTLGA